ncbi:DUF3192 domain-containing protein [Pseudoalteromonas sp.]|uniref:DUF3192 domain-containing protein n=1 Tax=Pseudoalteromonas sp. TaxID=53249 RepID=UPI00356952AD
MNNKILKYIILGLGIYAIAAGLIITFYKDDPQGMYWQDRESFNKRYLNKLKVDKPVFLDQVFNNLGSPDLTFAKRSGDDVFQIIYYRTQHEHSDGITTKDECTGMFFKNEQLVAWGPGAEIAYDKVN